MKNNKEDNPVPSLLIKFDEESITEEQFKGIKDAVNRALQKDGWYQHEIKLINGVENDKEQPIKETDDRMGRISLGGYDKA